jgi:hypothetical protein
MPKRQTQVDGGNTMTDEQNLATEASAEEIQAEQPKEKIGDKPQTVVDAKEKKPRLQMPRGIQVFRVKDGVDANKYPGQRGHVIRALQKLANEKGKDAYFTLEDIDSNTEGLVTRVDHKASVLWHLKGLVATQQADVKVQEAEKPAEAAA